jgi:hypothetical protein
MQYLLESRSMVRDPSVSQALPAATLHLTLATEDAVEVLVLFTSPDWRRVLWGFSRHEGGLLVEFGCERPAAASASREPELAGRHGHGTEMVQQLKRN